MTTKRLVHKIFYKYNVHGIVLMALMATSLKSFVNSKNGKIHPHNGILHSNKIGQRINVLGQHG